MDIISSSCFYTPANSIRTKQNPTENAVDSNVPIKNGIVNSQYHHVTQRIKIIDELANVILVIVRLINDTNDENGNSIKPTSRHVNG